MKNIFYLDLESNRIKTALHARFDEGMNDLDTPTPNFRQLRLAMGQKLPEDTIFTPAPVSLALDIVSSPFLDPVTITIPVKCSTETMRFIVESCSIRGRGYLAGLHPNSTASDIRGRNKKLVGSYVIQVNDTPVYSKDDILEAIGICSELAIYDKSPTITLTFATVKSSPRLEGIPQIQVDQLRNVVRHLYELDHGYPLDPINDVTDEDIIHVIKSGGHGTGKGSQFTRR